MSAPQRMCNLMCDQTLAELKQNLEHPAELVKWFQEQYLIVDQMEGPIPEYQLAEQVQLDEGKQTHAARVWRKLQPSEQEKLVKVVEAAAGPAAAEEFAFEMSSR